MISRTCLRYVLQGLGNPDVIDLGLVDYLQVELAGSFGDAGGGIILTASHNPIQWEAFKNFLNSQGNLFS